MSLAQQVDTALFNQLPNDYVLREEDFRVIADTIHADAGIHLVDEKKPFVYSRLAKRLRALKLASFAEYCALILSDDGQYERKEMLSALTTNVTHFFREPHHFEHLKKVALPPLIKEAQKGGRIRIWSAGCSNGQEPYSIAISILEMLPGATNLDIKILATDIDPNVIAEGHRASYPVHLLDSLPNNIKAKYFHKDATLFGENYCLNDNVRKLIAFRELNLVASNWPMRGKFDAIFCRNVTIYFRRKTQQGLWSKLSHYLTPKGWLYIGHSERLTGPAADNFEACGTTTYKKTSGK